MPDHATVVVMLGGVSGGPLESIVRETLEASALDSIEFALKSGRFEQALLLADDISVGCPEGITVELDREHSQGDFHFGRRLGDAVQKHQIERFLYLGAGSVPLLGSEEFGLLADSVIGHTPKCVTNNFFSADFFAFNQAHRISTLDPPADNDNCVPRRLKEEYGVEVEELPRTTANQLNIDSPTELVALKLSGKSVGRLRDALDRWDFDTEMMSRAAMTFIDRDAEILVSGRVSSQTWQYLERETASRVRVFSEERGMSVAGRDEDGSARSLMGRLILEVGPAQFFGEVLPELCDAAFIDNRPILAQLGIQASRADRFAADLGLVTEIEDQRLRDLIKAAMASPVPIVMGGHSLVAGVLMLLCDWAWEQRDHALGT